MICAFMFNSVRHTLMYALVMSTLVCVRMRACVVVFVCVCVGGFEGVRVMVFCSSNIFGLSSLNYEFLLSLQNFDTRNQIKDVLLHIMTALSYYFLRYHPINTFSLNIVSF